MKVRLLLFLALATAVAALVAAGCGGDDGGSGSDPASIAPPNSPIFIDVAVQPEGDLQANLEGLAKNLAGIDDLGGLIVEQLENGAAPGDEVDFEKEIAPWLGEHAGISLQEYD